MSTERLDDLYIPQPAARGDDDAFLPLRLFACMLVGIAVATALVAALAGRVDVWPSGAEGETAVAGYAGAAVLVVLAYPLLLLVWGFAATAAWYLLRRYLPCIVAILLSLTWLAFGA